MTQMARKLEPSSDRGEAVYRAAVALKEKHGSENKVAIATGIKQQSLNKLIGRRVLGIELADKIAAAYDTTVDGLVALFIEGGEGVKASDVPGWAKAVEEAREQFGDVYPYPLAGRVVLPISPRRATAHFVRDLADLFMIMGR